MSFLRYLQNSILHCLRQFKYEIPNYQFPLNNIFQQKFNMSTPNHYMSKYSQLPYPLLINPWNIPSPNLYPLNNQLRYPHFPQHFNFPYPFSQANYLGFSQPLPFNFSSSIYASQPNPALPIPSARQVDISGINKFQKNQRKGDQAAIIQISDDEDHAQQEKLSEDKSTCPAAKTNLNDSLPNNKTNEEIKRQQEPSKKIINIKINQEKQIKTTKNKIIQKIKNQKKKQKIVMANEVQLRKGFIFSQRIIQRKDLKKDPYRISKRERQMLQIGNLRDIVNQILTGPRFQANLPPFTPEKADGQSWKIQKRANLLQRMQRYQQDS